MLQCLVVYAQPTADLRTEVHDNYIGGSDEFAKEIVTLGILQIDANAPLVTV